MCRISIVYAGYEFRAVVLNKYAGYELRAVVLNKTNV